MEYLTQENISIVLSLIALIVSVASPFVAYYFLVPQMQEFHNRPRLELGVYVNSEFVPANSNLANSVPKVINYWGLAITNEGFLPAKNVQVIFHYTTLPDGEVPPLIVVSEPPINLESRVDGTDILITLKAPIAPNETTILKPKLVPDEAWVYTEYGEKQSIILTSETGRKPKPRHGPIIELVK